MEATFSRCCGNATASRGVPKKYKGIYTSKLLKLDLTTEYVANLVNVNMCMVVNMQQCSLLGGYVTPA